MKTLLKLLGLLCLLMGLLWIGQGMGLIQWPADSFMIGASQWMIWGAVLAAVGLILLWSGRRR